LDPRDAKWMVSGSFGRCEPTSFMFPWSVIKPGYRDTRMNTDYMIRADDIIRINERYGGTIRSTAEIATAVYMGKGKGLFLKIAYLWRAILVGHPFTDGNKRTALAVAEVLFDRAGVTLAAAADKRLVAAIIGIAAENVEDVNRIERAIRYAVEKN
jgi:death-on-curing family protein